jgi:hypothetical protein
VIPKTRSAPKPASRKSKISCHTRALKESRTCAVIGNRGPRPTSNTFRSAQRLRHIFRLRILAAGKLVSSLLVWATPRFTSPELVHGFRLLRLDGPASAHRHRAKVTGNVTAKVTLASYVDSARDANSATAPNTSLLRLLNE